jgi:hypothetical protein
MKVRMEGGPFKIETIERTIRKSELPGGSGVTALDRLFRAIAGN